MLFTSVFLVTPVRIILFFFRKLVACVLHFHVANRINVYLIIEDDNQIGLFPFINLSVHFPQMHSKQYLLQLIMCGLCLVVTVGDGL